MTTAEVSARFTVVFTGREYLCIPPWPLGATCAQPHRPLELDVSDAAPVVPAYVKVWDALPGIIGDLVERTKLNQATVYGVLGKMRAQGKVQSVKTSTLPVMYSRIAK